MAPTPAPTCSLPWPRSRAEEGGLPILCPDPALLPSRHPGFSPLVVPAFQPQGQIPSPTVSVTGYRGLLASSFSLLSSFPQPSLLEGKGGGGGGPTPSNNTKERHGARVEVGWGESGDPDARLRDMIPPPTNERLDAFGGWADWSPPKLARLCKS